jgi:phage tail sheath protein FI
MTQTLRTPGVYIEEKSSFPNSAVAVGTAVPAFVGYTEVAKRGTKSLANVPTRISSLSEFHQFFGGAPSVKYTVEPGENGVPFKIAVDAATDYKLYSSMRLFFANGGSDCWIVAVGVYGDAIKKDDIIGEENEGGITALLKEPEPTMLVIPDAVLLEENECYSVQQGMLKHCGLDMRSRIALLDIWGGREARTMDENDVVTKFREGVGSNQLDFGTAYYPWVETTITAAASVTFDNINEPTGNLTTILNTYVDDQLAADEIDEKRGEEVKAEIAKLADLEANDSTALHQALSVISPMYKDILVDIATDLNRLPPSGGMAGVLSMVDNSVGVWKSPANVSIGSVVEPTINVSNKQQEDLNVPLNGKAVNAIRTFPGKGVLVWGARTLDGNSLDWRYLSVRRTVIMIEQSIKISSEAYVFEPNELNTWVAIRGTITNFLKDQWKQGALAGTTPEDAFSVDVGLGSTMTPTDILEGVMRISVKMAITRPAEFIVITFEQQMQKS